MSNNSANNDGKKDWLPTGARVLETFTGLLYAKNPGSFDPGKAEAYVTGKSNNFPVGAGKLSLAKSLIFSPVLVLSCGVSIIRKLYCAATEAGNAKASVPSQPSPAPYTPPHQPNYSGSSTGNLTPSHTPPSAPPAAPRTRQP